MPSHRPLDSFASSDAAEQDPTQPGIYRWVPDGSRCDACGETAVRFWRVEDRFVCIDCKEW